MTAGRVLLALLAAWPAAAVAQVTIDNGALDALRKPDAPARPAPPRRAAARLEPRPGPNQPAPNPPAATKPAAAPTPASATAPAKPAAAAKPTVPATPPAILALPPPVDVPLAHPPPAPTVPVADDAPGTAAPMGGGGLRVTFGTGRADLNPATVAALRSFAQAQLAAPAGTGAQRPAINILAYAAGSAEDPSTPRRLSLERAGAARAVLLAAGMPSARIYPRALGPAGGDVDPDRIDLVPGPVTPTPAPSAAPRPAANPAAGPAPGRPG